MERYFPHSAWIRCDRDTVDALGRYKTQRALPTWDATLTALLAEVVIAAVMNLDAAARPAMAETDPGGREDAWPATGGFDPEAFFGTRPAEAEAVEVDGHRVERGSRVRLRPGARRTDAQDMFLVGRRAVVENVLRDVDDRLYLAVTLDDDPAAGLHGVHGRCLYFGPDEVEPCEAGP